MRLHSGFSGETHLFIVEPVARFPSQSFTAHFGKADITRQDEDAALFLVATAVTLSETNHVINRAGRYVRRRVVLSLNKPHIFIALSSIGRCPRKPRFMGQPHAPACRLTIGQIFLERS